jgi:LysM repeat protein
MKRKIIIVVAVVALLVATFVPAQAQSSQSWGNCNQFYQVQRGDTLARIARTYGTTWSYLASINGISNPNRIYSGQVLCVSVYTPPPQQTTYVVQRGDWLSRIAQRFGVSLYSLIQANSIFNPNIIYPGQVLVIPIY